MKAEETFLSCIEKAGREGASFLSPEYEILPPASEQDILAAESSLGGPFPAEIMRYLGTTAGDQYWSLGC